jgi:hypothetical protein
MSERTISRGTSIMFGAPANPMPEQRALALSSAVASVTRILEAYIPQCYVTGDKEARQVLVVRVNTKDEIPSIMQELMAKLKAALPPGDFIDILPYPSNGFPQAARVGSCHLLGSPPKPWWKVF